MSFLKNRCPSLPALKGTRVGVNLARGAPSPKTETLHWQISRSGVLVSRQRPWILVTVTYKCCGEAPYWIHNLFLILHRSMTGVSKMVCVFVMEQ